MTDPIIIEMLGQPQNKGRRGALRPVVKRRQHREDDGCAQRARLATTLRSSIA
jgi:hypothetical protein